MACFVRAVRASLVRGAGGDGTGCGPYGEPFSGAGYAMQDASAFGGADGFVAFFGQGNGLGLFVG
jgi:hypothetical protein